MSDMRASLHLAAACLGFLQAAPAEAAPAWVPDNKALTWADGATITLAELDCSKSGYSGLVVGGTVTLVHPQPSPVTPQTIRLFCPYIVFKNGAQILSKEELYLKISTQVAGPVRLINTRGEKGAAAAPSEEIWKATKQPKASDGASGGDGRDAQTDFTHNHGSDRGGDGGRGTDGARGADGAQGNPGGVGGNAARIQLRVADFADGSTLVMTAIGGDGGPGGKGGRGRDGGDGGNGGPGGKGGDGNTVHDGSSGGSGGNGGNGGDGGNGGTGGNGGPGGNGADVMLLMQEGGQAPADLDMRADGGYGGVPGAGGDPGIGGAGGKGGPPGCGGSGGAFIFVQTTPGGSCGTNGVAGRPGQPGHQGPPGAFGTNGSPGNILKVILQYVPKAAF